MTVGKYSHGCPNAPTVSMYGKGVVGVRWTLVGLTLDVGLDEWAIRSLVHVAL